VKPRVPRRGRDIGRETKKVIDDVTDREVGVVMMKRRETRRGKGTHRKIGDMVIAKNIIIAAVTTITNPVIQVASGLEVEASTATIAAAIMAAQSPRAHSIPIPNA
jgi:hypothetical protein